MKFELDKSVFRKEFVGTVRCFYRICHLNIPALHVKSVAKNLKATSRFVNIFCFVSSLLDFELPMQSVLMRFEKQNDNESFHFNVVYDLIEFTFD